MSEGCVVQPGNQAGLGGGDDHVGGGDDIGGGVDGGDGDVV